MHRHGTGSSGKVQNPMERRKIPIPGAGARRRWRRAGAGLPLDGRANRRVEELRQHMDRLVTPYRMCGNGIFDIFDIFGVFGRCWSVGREVGQWRRQAWHGRGGSG